MIERLAHLYIEVRCQIEEALGNGADEEAWRPGEHWSEAAIRGLKERDELKERVKKLEQEIESKKKRGPMHSCSDPQCAVCGYLRTELPGD